MRILGVDPGLRVTGYGVIEIPKKFSFGDPVELVEMGVVKTSERAGISARLEQIYTALSEAITELKPDLIAIEKLYAHYKHPSTAILMGHARGVVCLLSGVHGLPLANVAPTHVKKAVTGHGHANKEQVQRMVQRFLGLSKPPEPADVSDALAIALSHAFNLPKSRS